MAGAPEGTAALQVPLELTTLLPSIKRALRPEFPQDNAAGLVRDLHRAVELLDPLVSKISDEALKSSQSAASHHRSVFLKWISATRALEQDHPDVLCSGRGMLQDFLKEVEDARLSERFAPTRSYPHIDAWGTHIDSLIYCPETKLMTLQLLKIKAGGRGLTPICRSLSDWAIIEAPVLGTAKELRVSKADVLANPRLARILESIISGIRSGSKQAHAVNTVIATEVVPSMRLTLQVNSDANGEGWSFSYRQISNTMAATRLDSLKSDGFMDLEPILRHNAAEPLKIGFNHSNKHRQPPTEKQKEALIHWARGCIVLIDAALAFGKTVKQAKMLVAAFMNIATRVRVKTEYNHEKDLSWGSDDFGTASKSTKIYSYTKIKISRESDDLGVPEWTHHFSVPDGITKKEALGFWQTLKLHSSGLWHNGKLYALAIDMSTYDLSRFLEVLLDLVSYGTPRAKAVWDVIEPHQHDDREDKIECKETLSCHLCGVKYQCRLVSMVNSGLCPEHLALFAGESRHNQYGRTPLLQSVADNAVYDRQQSKGAQMFLNEHLSKCSVPCDLVCLSLPLDKSNGAVTAAFKKLETASEAAGSSTLRGFESIIVSQSILEHSKFAKGGSAKNQIKDRNYFVMRVVRKLKNFDERTLKQQGFTVEAVVAYRNTFNGLISYDHIAVPRSMRASLDQHRVFFYSADHQVAEHVGENVDVQPLHAQFLKHTQPPEFVPYCGTLRFIVCVVMPTLTADSSLPSEEIKARLDKDMNILTSLFRKLSTLIPHERQARQLALQDAKLCEQINIAYRPIIAYGKRAGLTDACYEGHDKLPAQPTTDTTDASRGVVGNTSKVVQPMLDAAEALETDLHVVSERIYRDGNKSTIKRFVRDLGDKYKPVLTGLYKQLKIKDDFAFTLEGISEPMSQDLIQLKIWHWLLLIEWCDRYGFWWLGFAFITFWVINMAELQKCGGRCRWFGLQLSGYQKDLSAFADAHFVHGISMIYGVQRAEKVSSMADINLNYSNVSVQSRAANYWLHDFNMREVRLADAALIELGHRTFKALYPKIYESLQASTAFQKAIEDAQHGSDVGFERGAYNKYWDLPSNHVLHPSQKNTHVVL